MTRHPLALAAGLFALLLASPASAHEGHSHGDEQPAPTPVVAGATRSANGEHVELVLRVEEGGADASGAGHVHLLVADLETNAPIEGATVEVTPRGADSAWTAVTVAPGIYDAHVPRAEGPLDVLVRREDVLDLIAFDSLVAAPVAAAPAEANPARRWALAAAAIALAAVVVSLLVAFARRGRRAGAAAGFLALLGLATFHSSFARAHEGELHGTEKASPDGGTPAHRVAGAASVPPGARFIAKEGQFEIGLRTTSVREETLAPTRTAIGTVVADPGARATLVAPQTGRFTAARSWRIGDRIGRGQAFGAVLVVDDLPVRAPLAGSIATLDVVSGQTVAAGQALATVVDLGRVRIELPLFGDALAEGLRATSARVRVPGLEARERAARIAGLAPTADGPGTPFVVVAENADGLLRPGMTVEVALALPGAAPALTVPAAALVTTEQGPAVFVKIAPEAFVLRAVTPGARAGDRVAIVRGVSAGEKVVVAGLAPLLATAEAPR